MKKRDMSTRDLSIYLHTTVEEVRKLQAEPDVNSLESKASTAPELKEDSDAWYCRNRTDGFQYSIEVNGQRYCLLKKPCYCQVQNGHKAKKCSYKRR
jgi:hypothetical protein